MNITRPDLEELKIVNEPIYITSPIRNEITRGVLAFHYAVILPV